MPSSSLRTTASSSSSTQYIQHLEEKIDSQNTQIDELNDVNIRQEEKIDS